jgi:hypothetical protein
LVNSDAFPQHTVGSGGGTLMLSIGSSVTPMHT